MILVFFGGVGEKEEEEEIRLGFVITNVILKAATDGSWWQTET